MDLSTREAAIRAIESTVPEEQARAAFLVGDTRLIGIAGGFGASVPGLSLGERDVYAPGAAMLRLIPGTGCIIEDDIGRRLLHAAPRYADRFNREMVRLRNASGAGGTKREN